MNYTKMVISDVNNRIQIALLAGDMAAAKLWFSRRVALVIEHCRIADERHDLLRESMAVDMMMR